MKDSKMLRKVIIPIIFLIIFCAEAMIGFSAINVTEGKQDVLYSYKATPSGTYSVNLKDNNYTDSKIMGMNKLYISKFVNNISEKFNYQYSGSTEADLTYTYSVNANIIGEYQTTDELENNEVWNKSYVLVPSETKTLRNELGFTLSKDLVIDFEQYNAIVENFYKEISIPMDAYLSVVFKVSVRGVPTSNVGTVNEESSYEMKIPLNEQAFQITTKSKTNEVQNISKVTTATRTVNALKIIVALGAFVLTALAFYKYCKTFAKKNESVFERQINRILKEYGDIIVEINTLMDISNMTIVEVKSFNELIDLEAEVRIPILYYGNGNEGWFMIIQGTQLYRFVLREGQE